MAFTLRQLQYFVAAAEQGAISQSGYGKDMSLYVLEDYTAVRHVMVAH
jgi:acyl-CoA reductase-like NAD-dependent aldehyde dehydrogenase